MKLSLDEQIGPVLAIAVTEVAAAFLGFLALPHGVGLYCVAPIPILVGYLPGLAMSCPILLIVQFLAYPVVFGLGLAGNHGWKKAAAILGIVHLIAMVVCLIWVVGF